MKKLTLLLAALAVIAASLLSGCSKSESADARDLLASIPNDASVVAVANLQSLLEKAGCKIDGSEVKPSADMTGAVNGIKDNTMRSLLSDFINGKGGIEPTVGVVFTVGYYTYFSGIVSDPSAFKASVEKATGAKFSVQDDVDICANTALKDNRFWVNVGSSQIDARDAKHFATLSEEQSFLSNSASENLCKIEKDVEGWGNLSGLLNTANFSFQEKASVQVALQTLFEDPTNFCFTVNFEKGQMLAEGKLLNSKGKTAKYLFPTAAIDLKTVEGLGGTADAVIAASIPGKLIKKLEEDTKSKQPSMLGVILPSLSSVDGTVAVAFDSAGSCRGVIITTGENTGSLTNLLGTMGVTSTINGKEVNFKKGEVTGPQNVTEMSKFFKGAVIGVASGVPRNAPGDTKNTFESGALVLLPDGDGLAFRITLLGTQKDVNFIVPLLKQGGSLK